MSPKLPEFLPEESNAGSASDAELPFGEAAFSDEAVEILAALDTPQEPRRIGPSVTLFVPPHLRMPHPDEEPPYIDMTFPDGRTYRQRCLDACRNMADAVASRIPDEPGAAITEWRLMQLRDSVAWHLTGTALRHPRYGARIMPGFTTSPVLAFAPDKGWALTFGGWYSLGKST